MASEKELLLTYGSPLFLVYRDRIEKQVSDLKQALRRYYPKSKIFYSYKTSYLPHVCKFLSSLGVGAEIVSSFEFDLAKKVGVESRDILWNGPNKKTRVLEAIREGATVNATSWEELSLLNEISKELNVNIPIGVRVYSEELGSLYHAWTRFGFSLESGEAKYAIEKYQGENKEGGKLDISGIQFHLNTNIYRTEVYETAIFKVGKFVGELEAKHNFKLRFFDVGGGFPVKDNRPTMLPSWETPSVDLFISSIATAIKNNFNSEPMLIIEPGRYVIADAVELLTSVLSSKVTDSGQKVVVDASVTLLPHAEFIKYPIESVPPKENSVATTIFGITPMQSDIISTCKLPLMRQNDIIKIKSVGAYSISRASSWVSLKPAVVFIDNGKAKLIKKGETLHDFLSLDIF